MPDRTSAPPRAWQRMLSGRRLDLLDPSPLDVEIEDIARGLARVARWNGQTEGPHAFSVAQHTLLVDAIAGMTAPQLDARGRLAVMLHDAPEYVIGDLISPFKALLGGEYRAIEARLLAAIHRRFGVPTPLPARTTAMIKAADRIAAFYEATRVAGFSEPEARRFFGNPRGVEADRLDLKPWPAATAEKRFLARFKVLLAAASG
ncbi:MAG: HD family hydrolase [Bauldia sp.]|nr:HD family hydrolase [Bauldia sp.]